MGLVVESCATGMIADECIQPLQLCGCGELGSSIHIRYKTRCTERERERGVLYSGTNYYGDYSSNNGKWGRTVGETGVVVVRELCMSQGKRKEGCK